MATETHSSPVIPSFAFEIPLLEEEPVPSAWERMQRADAGVCRGFAWVGQPFSSCNNCARPYWEHSHEERVAKDSLPFDGRWRRVIIPTAQAENCRAKWGGRS